MPNELAPTSASAELQRQQLLTQLQSQLRLPRSIARRLDHDNGEAVLAASRVTGVAYVSFTGMQHVESALTQKARIVDRIPVDDIGRRFEAEAHLGPIVEALAAITVAEVYGLHRRYGT